MLPLCVSCSLMGRQITNNMMSKLHQVVITAMEDYMPGSRGEGNQSRSRELKGVARDTLTPKATFEQRPEGWETGSHGDPGGRKFQTECREQGGEEEMEVRVDRAQNGGGGRGGNLARPYRPLRGISILLLVKPLTVISRERTCSSVHFNERIV